MAWSKDPKVVSDATGFKDGGGYKSTVVLEDGRVGSGEVSKKSFFDLEPHAVTARDNAVKDALSKPLPEKK